MIRGPPRSTRTATLFPYTRRVRSVETEIRPTIADGIASERPVRLREVMAALRETGGTTVAVSEAEILAALARLARSGFFVEPTSAAGAAGLGDRKSTRLNSSH